MPSKTTTPFKVERAVFAEGRCVLIARRASDDKFLVGLGVKPKSAYNWARGPITKQDRARLQEAIDELPAEE